MTTPVSNLGMSNIKTEFGGTTNNNGLSSYYAGGSYVPAGTKNSSNVLVPTSGQIEYYNLQGATKTSYGNVTANSSSSAITVNEGTTVNFRWTPGYIPDQPWYWRTTGTAGSGDLSSISGIINSNGSTYYDFSITIINDYTADPSEYFIVEIHSNSSYTNQVAGSPQVNINDSSNTPVINIEVQYPYVTGSWTTSNLEGDDEASFGIRIKSNVSGTYYWRTYCLTGGLSTTELPFSSTWHDISLTANTWNSTLLLWTSFSQSSRNSSFRLELSRNNSTAEWYGPQLFVAASTVSVTTDYTGVLEGNTNSIRYTWNNCDGYSNISWSIVDYSSNFTEADIVGLPALSGTATLVPQTDHTYTIDNIYESTSSCYYKIRCTKLNLPSVVLGTSPLIYIYDRDISVTFTISGGATSGSNFTAKAAISCSPYPSNRTIYFNFKSVSTGSYSALYTTYNPNSGVLASLTIPANSTSVASTTICTVYAANVSSDYLSIQYYGTEVNTVNSADLITSGSLFIGRSG